MKLNTLLLATLALSPFAYAKSDVMAHHLYARATAPTATTSAVFAQIMNNGNQDRFIVSAETDVAGKVELHDVITEGDVMKMRQIPQFKVPAQGKLELKPGSFHIMLLDLKKPLAEGEEINVALTFANGEQQMLTVPVKKVMNGMAHH